MALRDVVFSKNVCTNCDTPSALYVDISQPASLTNVTFTASLVNVTFTANLPSGHAIDCNENGNDNFYKGGHYAQLTFNGKTCPSPPLVPQGALAAPGHPELV